MISCLTYQFLNSVLDGTELTPTVSKYCETADRPIATHHKIAIVICGVYIAFVIFANVVCRWFEHRGTFCDHFDVVTNTEKLYSETKDPLAQRISFFHGIRFFYQVAVISAHVCDIQPFLSAIYRKFLVHSYIVEKVLICLIVAVFYERQNHWWLLKQMYRSTGFFIQIPFAVR